MQKPLLSIGIIFKNEIRCLERCLKSLQPLRDAIPCELVMADTGATDGSRAVAERYADTLIDFEWINDFAAARNAVMNQCSGKWYMSIDCDEWLGGDLSKLASFLQSDETLDYGAVVVRNYSSAGLEKDGEYSDFDATRLLRMSTGLRYEGAIHEHWPPPPNNIQNIRLFPEVLFHHDGYLYNDPVITREKHERNMVLLRKKLENNPEDLTTLLQCIESADGSPELLDYIKRGIQCVKDKKKNWEILGGPILRYAVIHDYKSNSPELREHIQLAEELVPDSIYTQIDVQFAAFGMYWQEKNYKECIPRAEGYLDALTKYEAGKYNRLQTMCSTLLLTSHKWKNQLLAFLGGSYLYEGQPEKGIEVLRQLDGAKMTAGNVNNVVAILSHFHSRTMLDTTAIVQKLWEALIRPIPDEDRGKQRRNEFIRVGADFFRKDYQETEKERDDFHRHAYTMFLPLAGKCTLGDACAIIVEDDAAKLEQLLVHVEDWNTLPTRALAHALACNIRFPLPEKPMKMEELDILSGRLAQEKDYIRPLLNRLSETNLQMDLQSLDWARALILSAIRSISDWNEPLQTDWNQMIVQIFVQVEKIFLPCCYAAGALNEKNIDILPPMHRFGWYCTQAFDALENGNLVGYVRFLRAGLKSCGDMKPMVEFLLEHTPELQAQPAPSAELLTLAEQIRGVLANFAPDDPAVAALKQSEAYQSVAHLIEGAPAVGWGGLAQ